MWIKYIMIINCLGQLRKRRDNLYQKQGENSKAYYILISVKDGGKMSRILCKTKTGLKLLARLLICVVIGTALMISVYFIPISQIEHHVEESAKVFEREGSYPSFSISYCNSDRDNYTDAWMLLEAAYNSKSNNSPIILSMSNYRYGIEELDPAQSIVEHYINGKEFDQEILYGRYWNGYLSYLKPLLFFVDYSTIRYINIGFQMILFLIVVLLFYKKGLKQYIIPYILSILMAMPFAIVLNIQLTNCYTVFNIGIIVLLLTKKCIENKISYIFLYLGVITSFIDLLSYPLVTFGIPAVVYFCLTKVESIKTTLLKLLKIGIPWCLGYGGMWISKWIVGSVLSGKNLFSDGFNQFLYRAGTAAEQTGSSESFSIFETIYKNIRAFLFTPATLLIGAFVIVMIILVIRNLIQGNYTLSEILTISFPYLILMTAPLIWYIVIRNHSAIHAYGLANKELLITIMSLSFLLIKLYLCTKKQKSKIL